MSSPVRKYLYVILWPNYALVASNLPPEEFGEHYILGSSRFFHGQAVFAEIDGDYRNPYFKHLEPLLKEVVPDAQGRPKRTKFISTYRVLEHVDLSAFKELYITSMAGKVLPLKKATYDRVHETGYIRIFQELAPLRSIVLSYMTPQEFGQFISDPDQPKGAPKVIFTQIDLDIDAFLNELEADPYSPSPLPNIHPQKLKQQILEMRDNPSKRVKGISLDSVFGKISFLKLRTAFWIAADKELLCYPLPDQATLEKEHYHWVRSL